jgi:hypothetical protein
MCRRPGYDWEEKMNLSETKTKKRRFFFSLRTSKEKSGCTGKTQSGWLRCLRRAESRQAESSSRRWRSVNRAHTVTLSFCSKFSLLLDRVCVRSAISAVKNIWRMLSGQQKTISAFIRDQKLPSSLFFFLFLFSCASPLSLRFAHLLSPR